MEKSFKIAKEYWVILVVIGQFIFTIFTLQTGYKDHEKRIATLEQYREKEVIVLTDIQSRLASIETSILFIKDRLR